jgi:hypothetical protein
MPPDARDEIWGMIEEVRAGTFGTRQILEQIENFTFEYDL